MMANSTATSETESMQPPPSGEFEKRLHRLEQMALNYEVLQGELAGFRKEMQERMDEVVLQTTSTRRLLEETWKHQQADAEARGRRDAAFMQIMQDIFGELTAQGRGRIEVPPPALAAAHEEEPPAPSTPSSTSSSGT